MQPEYVFDYSRAKPNRFVAEPGNEASAELSWLEPWRPLNDLARARNLEAQLGRELLPGHALHGIKVVAIGVADDPDDVLFRVLDGTGRFATAHLTWHPGGTVWPHTQFFKDETDWLEHGMRADHEEYIEMQSRTDPT